MLENQIPSTPVLIQDLGMIYANETSKQKRHFSIYKCNCGNTFRADISKIKNGRTKSCGCHNITCIKDRQTTHGLSKNILYSTWYGMVRRCTDSTSNKFMYYGGRGITVCDRWQNVALFIEDMFPTYQEGLTIDRIDNNGNYEPSNCRWSTKIVQSRNTRVLRVNNTAGYKGIGWHDKAGKWMAGITVNYKKIYIGLFNTALDAAKAYDRFVTDNNLEHTINGVL